MPFTLTVVDRFAWIVALAVLVFSYIVFNWSVAVFVLLNMFLVFRSFIVVWFLDSTALLPLLVLFSPFLSVYAPLAMEFTLGFVPVCLLGSAEIVVVFPPVLPLLCVAIVPVLEALPVRSDHGTPFVPVCLEVKPLALEVALDLANQATEPSLKSLTWTRVGVLPLVVVALGVIALAITASIVAGGGGGVALWSSLFFEISSCDSGSGSENENDLKFHVSS